jgi:hypothetical protein
MSNPRSRLDFFNDRKADIVGPARHVYPLSSAEKVTLMTGCPEAGWMESRLTIGTDIFPILFSDVYTPIHDFVVWLENLVRDEPAAPVWADDEDQDHYFHASPSEEAGVLIFEYLRGHYSGDGLYRRAYVGKDQLILEFYMVLNSLNSLKFDDRIDPYREEEPPDVLPDKAWFAFFCHTDEKVRLDLSNIEEYLANKGLLPVSGAGL